jgi:DNA-binding transcriptional MerR regulator
MRPRHGSTKRPSKTSSRRPRSSRRVTTAYFSRDAVCTLGGISIEQLRLWEYEDFVAHARVLNVNGRPEPVYDQATLRRIKTIRSLGEHLGINLPGIGVILHLLDQLTNDE